MTGVGVSPVLIGRRSELEQLRGAYDAGDAGGPSTVVLRGDAGMGKTRLLSEFTDRVSDPTSTAGRAAVVAHVGCVDGGRETAPLLPVRRLVRELTLSHRDAVVEAVCPDHRH